MMALTYLDGVTSKAGLRTPMPSPALTMTVMMSGELVSSTVLCGADRSICCCHVVPPTMPSFARMNRSPARSCRRSDGRSPRAAPFCAITPTGISARDSAYETISSRLDKRLDGFGELFRMLSFEEIGAAAMLSRAVGGIAMGRPLFALPGSTAAVRLGIHQLILPQVGHLHHELTRHATGA